MEKSKILETFRGELAEASTPDELVKLRAKYVGRNGIVTNFRKDVDLSAMSVDERKRFGKDFNEIKSVVEDALAQAAEGISARRQSSGPGFDLTLPGAPSQLGCVHPIISTQIEVEDIFHSMGFQVLTGNEAVAEFDNFDAVNVPADHAARDMQDTFWLENGWVLRTHTSAMQNRALRQVGAPMRAIFPGRCFRNEATDMTHENTFYQLEGMMVDEGVSVANLIAVMKELLDRVFHRDIEVRLRPGYFPFVEPGFELDFRTVLNGVDRWIELMPCGMIHPRVLELAGIDHHRYNGFAFGLGLTRLAMLKHNVADVRHFNRGDIRFYEQFTATL